FRGAMAFDQRSAVTVLFGGESATAPYMDTWTWNGEDWTAEHPAVSPTRRYSPAMAYDAQRGNAVLFGGTSFGVRLNDTWTWDGATWTKRTTPAPAAKGFGYLTYTTKSQEVVAYVYYAQDNHPVTAYTITWDGNRWTDRSR